jgi:hypothetical protein
VELSGCDLENGEELLSHDRGDIRIRGTFIEKNGFFQTVEICRTVRTPFEVTFEFTALGRGELGIELLANVVQNIVATDSFLFHAVM